MKKYLYLLALPLCVACAKLDTLDYIQFKAGFDAPSVVRVGEQITFRPNATTTGAQSFFWRFGRKSFTSAEQNPVFSYDTIGVFTTTFTVKMDKKGGIVTDSVKKTIFALPPTYNQDSELYTETSIGSSDFNNSDFKDDLGMSFAPISGGGFFTVSQYDLNTISVGKVKADLSANDWRFEIAGFGASPVYPKSVLPTLDGGCMIAGYTETGVGDSDAFILKLNANGREEWRNTDINSSNYERYTSVAKAGNGVFAVAGSIGKTATTAVPVVHLINGNGDFINKISYTAYKNCHINQIRYFDAAGTETATIKNKFLLAGKYSEQPIAILLNSDLSVSDIGKVNIAGEAYSIDVSKGGQLHMVGRGYTKGNASTEDSTSYAFHAMFKSIIGAPPTWTKTAKMYREHYKDAFFVSNAADADLICLGEHFNPLSRHDLFFTRINIKDGDIRKIRLLGDDAEQRPIAMHYDSTSGYIYIFLSTRWVSETLTGLYDIAIIKTKLSDIL